MRCKKILGSKGSQQLQQPCCQNSGQQQKLPQPAVLIPAVDGSIPRLAALNLQPHEVITLVGGGGKTSLMYALTAELAVAGARIIITTTTKIMLPKPEDVNCLLVAAPEQLLNHLRHGLTPQKIIGVGSAIHGDKLIGIPPQLVDELAASDIVDYILVEGDGAAGRPFKAPAKHEPVIPHCSTRVLTVVGLDALNAPLNAANCHRPELIATLSGLIIGKPIQATHIAQVLYSPQGGRKNVPPTALWLPVINKVDDEIKLAKATEIAAALAAAGAKDIIFTSTLNRQLKMQLWQG